MSLLQNAFLPNPRFHHFQNPNPNSHLFFFYSSSSSKNPNPNSNSKPLRLSVAAASDPNQNPNPNPNPNAKPRRRLRPKSAAPQNTGDFSDEIFPATIPRKPRRGRRSEAVAVEDFVRDSLERTFASIREQNAGVLDEKEEILKKRIEEPCDDADEGEEDDGGLDDGRSGKEVVEEDDPDWPLDADVGWGIRASDYFGQYPIKNVVVDGVEIDWEGELDDSWVKEINCLEWESFAFHPSPLMVLVFERYKR